ncbi:hypothetical protein [Blastopirellula marina]|uniref:Uncharacterized protein n=1 Tax=Blastopirellula marina TaxID=124 RepID=A0A2S8GHD5_9BACT|nr:hypothetical protein [Blastopirellula marina]PQO43872.1 hypothetical protein C5Y93_22060 [Blastopirellula marina]
MEIAFCEKWWGARKRPLNIISEEAARTRHEKRKPYVALLGGVDHPRFVVDIAMEWATINFLDSQQRMYLSYNFIELEPGKLFLKGAYYWEYEKDSDAVKSCTIFNFDVSGQIVIAEAGETSEVREFETTASVDENWDEYPAFGDYASLCVEERIIT